MLSNSIDEEKLKKFKEKYKFDFLTFSPIAIPFFFFIKERILLGVIVCTISILAFYKANFFQKLRSKYHYFTFWFLSGLFSISISSLLAGFFPSHYWLTYISIFILVVFAATQSLALKEPI